MSTVDATTDSRLSLVETRISSVAQFLTGQARIYRQLYYWLNGTQVVAASLVPILAFGLPTGWEKLGAAVAGAITAIAKGIDAVSKSHENWIRSITSREEVVSERNLFEARAGDYGTASDPIALLSMRVEAILANDRTYWAKTEQTKEDSGS